MTAAGRRILGDWGPVALMAVITVGASSNEFNANATHSKLAWLLTSVWPCDLHPVELERIHSLVRKMGHFLGYALIALLLARAFRTPRAIRRAAATLSVAAIWSSLDEYHQTTLPLRTAALSDVVLDMLGAASAVVALCAVYLMRRARPQQSQAVASSPN